jgi:glycosyltransferase involved in cell wall biosynthesis
MISFIVPTYNEEKRLGDTLHMISHYKGAREIIVSDDNSNDGTVEIAKKYTDKIVVNQNEKRGISANRNRGAKIAQGEYLVFVDADIRIDDADEFFKKAVNIFEKNQNIIALNVSVRILESFETMVDRIILGFLNYMFLVFNNFLSIGASSGEFQMIRADAFGKVRGFNENLVAGEDHEMFRRLAKIGKTYSEKTLTVYQDGRRVHAIGWPKLLWIWTHDSISVLFLKKSKSKEWMSVR